MLNEVTHEARVWKAEAALAVYPSDPSALSDLLADLMHWAHHFEEDWAGALLTAKVNFEAEVG